ncbi:MAG: class I SAM-dependent methyltransferase [Deltaproteobacteria bacterium]|nr:class I SAM-dependent methyltransferase [Deltaproteobacteria bacterium]
MKKVFAKKYATAYDYLYQDKDYEKECDFLEALFEKHSKKVHTILDLGCGTGRHAIILAKRGYKVTGVDRSAEMLNIARRRVRRSSLKVDLYKCSIQEIYLNKTFDAVISMFAVMSYQTNNDDLASACKIAKKHLKPEGIFIFDAWNGLTVLTDPPIQKVKEVNNGDERIIRITKPEIDILSHTVDTTFRVLTIKDGKLISETEETHKMRFFFPQEIKYFLEVAGFSKVSFCPFLQPERPLTEKDWNMTVIAK